MKPTHVLLIVNTCTCKHMYKLEDRAPPDKSGVLYHLLHIKFHGFNSRIAVITLWFMVLTQFFTDCMGPFIITLVFAK